MVFDLDAGQHLHGVEAEGADALVPQREHQQIILQRRQQLEGAVFGLGRLQHDERDLLLLRHIPQLIQDVEHGRGLTAAGHTHDQAMLCHLLAVELRRRRLCRLVIQITAQPDDAAHLFAVFYLAQTGIQPEPREAVPYRDGDAEKGRDLFHTGQMEQALCPQGQKLIRTVPERGAHTGRDVHIGIAGRAPLKGGLPALTDTHKARVAHAVAQECTCQRRGIAAGKHADGGQEHPAGLKLLVHLFAVVHRGLQDRQLFALPKDASAALGADRLAVHALPQPTEVAVHPVFFVLQIGSRAQRHLQHSRAVVLHQRLTDLLHGVFRRSPYIRHIKLLRLRMVLRRIGSTVVDFFFFKDLCRLPGPLCREHLRRAVSLCHAPEAVFVPRQGIADGRIRLLQFLLRERPAAGMTEHEILLQTVCRFEQAHTAGPCCSQAVQLAQHQQLAAAHCRGALILFFAQIAKPLVGKIGQGSQPVYNAAADRRLPGTGPAVTLYGIPHSNIAHAFFLT